MRPKPRPRWRRERVGADELDAIEILRGVRRSTAEARFRGTRQRCRAQYFSHMMNAADHVMQLGPLVPKGLASATSDGPKNALIPYHGYFFRILDSQGPHNHGGARSYRT